jgi:hypothetical protein
MITAAVKPNNPNPSMIFRSLYMLKYYFACSRFASVLWLRYTLGSAALGAERRAILLFQTMAIQRVRN